MLKEFLQQKLTSFYLKHVLQTTEGYSHVISQLADTEGGSGGELMLFYQLKEYMEDSELKKLVSIHEKDEEKHEKMFLDLLTKKGIDPCPVEDRFRILFHLDQKLNFLNKKVESDSDVVLLYTILKVIEERAVETYNSYLSSGIEDEDLMVVLRRIQEDEKKHLRFCDKVLGCYGTKNEIDNEYLRVKQVEEEVYTSLSFSIMQYQIDSGYFKHVREAFFWQVLRFWGMRFS